MKMKFRPLATLGLSLALSACVTGVQAAPSSPPPATPLSASIPPTAAASITTAPPSATSGPTATGQLGATALPGADRFALVVDKGCAPPGPAPHVRREDVSEVVARLGNAYLCQYHGATSPDGRRLAYWNYESRGRSAIALYQGGTSTTLVSLGEELLGSVAWSSDGTGLLFVAKMGGVQGVPPEYAALRTVDIATGSVQELHRVAGRSMAGFAWDRSARLTAAAVYSNSGGPSEYLVVAEARTITRGELPAGVLPVGASSDAAYMAAHSQPDGVIRYWPLAKFSDQKELRPPAGSKGGSAAWRPGTHELAVVVGTSGAAPQAIEMWSLDGSRRPTGVPLQGGGLFFRADGSALFVNGDTGIDLATGRTVRYALEQFERLVASVLR